MATPIVQQADAASPRRRLLALLADAGGALGVTELAELTGLHPNTLRGHLQILVDLGQVERSVAERTTPGRPRTLYRATAAQVPDNPYRELATELALGMANAENEGAAEAAGRAWGGRVRAKHQVTGALDRADAVRLAADAMGDLGFTAATEPLGDRIYLTGCPFAELARTNPSVCDVHAGLLAGLLTELDGSIELAHLDPFVRDALCVAHLRETSGGDQ